MPQGRTWDVVERCLALLVRLTRGPAITQELFEIIQSCGDSAEDLSNRQLRKRFENDRQKLEEIFGCELDYNRADGTWALVSMDRPLIDLPPDALRGLAFLQTTFSADTAPMRHEVRALTDVMLMLISESGRDEVSRERGLIEVDLRPRDEDQIPDNVWSTVQKTCTRHQELEFDYLSPTYEDGIPQTHRVEPMRCYFDSVRAHYYLEAYCIEKRTTNGVIPRGQMRQYRLGRMSNPHELPRKFVPSQRKPEKQELVYELTPEVARLGVTRHIRDSRVERRPDGSAIVRAVSSDLFFDLRTLLHYGPNCRVLGGERALRDMKALVSGMNQLYQSN